MGYGEKITDVPTYLNEMLKKTNAPPMRIITLGEMSQMIERAGFERVEMSHASDRHREFICIVGRKSLLSKTARIRPEQSHGC